MSPPPRHTGGSAHSSLCHLHPGTGQDPHQCPPARGLLVGCVPLGTQAGTQEGATRPPQHCAVPPSLRVAGEGHPQPGSQAGLGKGDTCVPTPGEPGVRTPPVHRCPPGGRHPPAVAASRGAEGRVVPAASRTAHKQRQGALPAPLLSPPSARRSFIKRKHKPEAEGSTFKLLAALPVYEL